MDSTVNSSTSESIVTPGRDRKRGQREAAIEYALAEWQVLPLKIRSKQPEGRLVPRGFLDASDDPAVVARWFSGLGQQLNIGIRTGAGLVVIDIDERHGGERDPSWPDTLTARTPGGWHLWYQSKADVPTRIGALARGIDLKGEGGYVVAPPSKRSGGRCWEWANCLPLADAPECVYAPPEELRRRDRDGRLVRAPFEPKDTLQKGERHAELTRWAGWLRSQAGGGYEGDSLLDILTIVNETTCTEPLPEKELVSIAKWAARLES